ncbi:MAG: type VI secretion system protein TssA [Candidatus Thiodiazotropha sp. (ex Dulcina madagascariensis)]|nr:type VI secretion system protein TssA [Candidatus Thiodiazotropha sp. (ex Dulcina madagascariensis)]MCU7927993.1 type VI secretion system protein TssA [Candidatus Thiodiazotropha sp. (ex Dulcina madagascariensis)]
MASIDLEQLLKAISEEAPTGADLEYDPLFGEMERAAEGKEEQQFGDTIIPAEDPDWRELKQKSLQILAQSKDLRAAIHLVRALVHTDGFAGLSDGLSLIEGYLDDYWDTLYPQLDPDDNNDPTIRINTLLNLCDPITFLPAVGKVPVVASTVMGKFSHRDMQIAAGMLNVADGDNQELSSDQIDAAFRECPTEQVEETLSQIRHAAESIGAIEGKLNERVGIDQSPDLQALGDLLKQIENEVAKRAGVESLSDASENIDASTPAGQAAGAAPGTINSRDDVIRTLERISRYYEQNEPSSPIPLLLERARRLVKMDFHEIVQDLAPGGTSHFDFLWKQEDR